jgi:outer membrane protein assembly factor BamB
VERVVKLKGKKVIGLFLLLAVTITLGLVGGCGFRGATAIGWSGGAVDNNTVFVGVVDAKGGRLVAYNLTDNTTLPTKDLAPQPTSGLLSCASALSCGGGTAVVPIYGTPVISGDSVYVAGYNGQIYAYKTDNLASRWKYPSNGYLGSFVGGAVVYENKLFIGSADGKIYALDTATGAKVAEYKTKDKIWGTPAIDEATGTLFIGSYDKSLYALSTDDLSPKWTVETKGSIISQPLVSNGIVYFGSFDKKFYAVNISDGSLAWAQPFTGNNWFWAKPELLDGKIYAACLDNFVYVLDPVTGEIVHEPYDMGNPVSSAPAIVDNLIIFTTREGVLFKIDSTNMVMSQVIDLKTTVDGPLMAYQGIVYVHPQTAVLILVNPVNGVEVGRISLES